MVYNLVTNVESCLQVSRLVYYSHIPSALAVLFPGLYVLFNSGKKLAGILMFLLALDYSVWCLFDLIIWTNLDSRMVMFFWMSIIPIDLLMYVLAAYLQHVFLFNGDIRFRVKLLIFLLFLPVLLLLSTKYNLSGFDSVSCNGIDGMIGKYYLYASEVPILMIIVVNLLRRLRDKGVSRDERRIAIYFSVSLFLFLAVFMAGNLFASIYETSNSLWAFSQHGLMGIVLFSGVLTYLIVRFKAFEVKLLGAQALVIALISLIGSQFFFIQNNTNKILTGITLVLSTVFGWILIRSVRKEVERKEQLQVISDSLALANVRLKELDNTKTEFISIASHQLRTPLTAIKGYLSLLLEGSYGAVSAEVMDVLEKVNLVNKNLIQLVEDLLNVSRIDAGRIKYSFEPTQLETLVAERVDMFMPIARDRGIELGLRLPKKTLPKMMIDPGKMREAISNLVDNSIKYTEKGSVIVSVGPVRDEAVRILVEDTGIGFREEDGAKLFGKFVRTQETTKVYVSGTGLGLFVGKSFVEAHGGRMWAESDGLGKGSRFYIELPFVNPKAPTPNDGRVRGEE